MKQTLRGALFTLLLSGLAFADDKSIRQEVFDRLDAIAAKLNVAVAHLWEVLVRQAYLDAWWHVAWFVLLGIGWAFWVRAYRRLGNWDDRENKEATPNRGVPVVICAIALSALTFINLVTSNHILAIFNPEYRAIELLRDAMTGR
jgi:hypothetical protein